MEERRNLSGRLDQALHGRRLHWRVEQWLRGLGRLQGFATRNIDPRGPDLKSIIFCTSYINDVARYRRWIDYVYPRRTAFGADCVVLINDGRENIAFDDRVFVVDLGHDVPAERPSDLMLFAFPERLGRDSEFIYPGWWRSFTYAVEIARRYGYEKIIHIESDAYVCSRRLADHVRQINRGWTVLWSNAFSFPEAAIQVICKHSFGQLDRYRLKGEEFFRSSNVPAEYLFPFTKIESSYKGDRAARLGRRRSTEQFDYLANVRPAWSFVSDVPVD